MSRNPRQAGPQVKHHKVPKSQNASTNFCPLNCDRPRPFQLSGGYPIRVCAECAALDLADWESPILPLDLPGAPAPALTTPQLCSAAP